MPTQGKNGPPKQGKKAETVKTGLESPSGDMFRAEEKASKAGKSKKRRK